MEFEPVSFWLRSPCTFSHIHISWFPQIPYQSCSVGLLTALSVKWLWEYIVPRFPLLKQISTHLHLCKVGQNYPLNKIRIKSFLYSLPAVWAWATSLISLSLGVPIYKMKWIREVICITLSWIRNGYYFIFTFYPASLNISILSPYACEKLIQIWPMLYSVRVMLFIAKIVSFALRVS